MLVFGYELGDGHGDERELSMVQSDSARATSRDGVNTARLLFDRMLGIHPQVAGEVQIPRG